MDTYYKCLANNSSNCVEYVEDQAVMTSPLAIIPVIELQAHADTAAHHVSSLFSAVS